jgi:hypothetical protein
VTRRRSTLSPNEIGAINIEMADTPPKATSQAKEDARALHILGGIYPAEVDELARAARIVRRIAPADAEVIIDALGLSEAS